MLACDSEPTPSNGLTHPGGVLSAPETWGEDVHVLTGSLILNATLTVEACAVIEMPVDGEISVEDGAAIRLLGTAECPVRVTSGQAVGAPGDWQYISIYSGSVGPQNVIQHAIIEYGGEAEDGTLWVGEGGSVEVSDTTFQYNAGAGVHAIAGATLRSFSGNSFVGNADYPVVVADSGDGCDVYSDGGSVTATDTTYNSCGV